MQEVTGSSPVSPTKHPSREHEKTAIAAVLFVLPAMELGSGSALGPRFEDKQALALPLNIEHASEPPLGHGHLHA
jgi:hypothetical protein